MPYRLRNATADYVRVEKVTADTPSNPILAENMRRLMDGRSIDTVRKAMADAKLAIGTGTLHKALKGESSNRLESLDKIAAFFGVSTDQLLQQNLGANDLVDQSHQIDLDEHPELSKIRKVRLRLQAGIGGYAVESDEEEGLPIFFRADWMAMRGYKPYNLLAIKVKGHSMETSLHEGDMVVINTADTVPKDGEVFAVNYEGEAVIKRLARDAGEWWLVSDNPDERRYPRKKWTDGSSLIVGRVIHKQSERI